MIVQVQGNVGFSITLDPTVWIFDDRKVLLSDAFETESDDAQDDEKPDDALTVQQYQQKINPPINDSVDRYNRKKVLENSYVMPLQHFIHNSEPSADATEAILHTSDGEARISISDLINCYLLFSVDGKPLKETGPVHVILPDGSNQDDPYTGVDRITVV
ncbi:hypothetical protein ABID56_000083 [Alkalibacillus flavidus]|uniref:Peptidyl-prolyl cis-trans isomerase n=1 Tax=Alkalibacillus flavidus TaxID=546021 RepID=A0ABV2KQY8_9BACI